ncbi:hypothetical protein SAMN06269173_106185 [Hymenobacter mucosus]|uniref:Uncharacterized protein n=2 Tax=Hymenobacter mucosus TaxID=1411120 RepID=A0A238YY62_9BACT|nr:hypothetical protein SAMN06269173_106185 [Hymenobacter mucosus]
MTASEYKRLKEQGNVLDFTTLNTTRELLEKAGHQKLVRSITEIIANGEISKPILHNNQNSWTAFFQVSLTVEDIDLVISTLLDAEVAALDDNYETTAKASFYALMVNRWTELQQTVEMLGQTQRNSLGNTP